MNDEDPSRARLIQAVAQTIWQHGLAKHGTASSSVDIGPDSLAVAIVDLFTCPECGFVDAFEGNEDGICNDCAPRVTARKSRCGSRYGSYRDDPCVCMKLVGHDARHVCNCGTRWTTDEETA